MKYLAAVIALTLLYEFPGKDLWAMVYLQSVQMDYINLVVECQTKMHVWRAIDAENKSNPTSETIEEAARAERDLAICHEHDVLRKKLLINGVSEQSIRLLGLRAFENESIPFDVFIAPHRM